MKIFPAIDLYDGKAVRLLRGRYEDMTVYSHQPESIVRDFVNKGAQCLHLVDLQGARDGGTPNFETVKRILKEARLFVEIGGGIRSMETIETYLSAGANRVILGTVAALEPGFVETAVQRFGSGIAVGADIRDGYVAVKGWTEKSAWTLDAFLKRMADAGVSTLIVTDIARDGAMSGTNRELYRSLASQKFDIVASGGVSTLDDVRALREMGLYGAIVGKAYYTGSMDLSRAIEVAK
ncbi:MAG: 1-(5-phosphoribosyl)-5-[(5-phosphoribosylamino)methylideneamino]imidazole-4-carboxamide isomerase [Eubacteriales bacterium]|nr:1-(5-phosphoribosyl)-5-[(5-phosphoribosylamino)methylideneamino]imidazole-4-carboxamide isomerase [Eubacteriales bacterium]